MAKYRNNLPQLSNELFLTDGGLETTLIFHDKINLPEFAAFVLLNDEEGRAALEKYFKSYIDIALQEQVGLILESPTWRANPDWAATLGYDREDLHEKNLEAIAMLAYLRQKYEEPGLTKMVISGCVGPQGDGYNPDTMMTAEQAQQYHQLQVDSFAQSEADLVTAITMTYPEEAIGVALAAKSVGMPVVISFTVETDGQLITGDSLEEAIRLVNEATDNYPAYYMVNCAHPSHFEQVLQGNWTEQIRGIRANASKCSHAELDEAEELDAGNPAEFGEDYLRLKEKLPKLNVLGGCCGTDTRHIKAVVEAMKGVVMG